MKKTEQFIINLNMIKTVICNVLKNVIVIMNLGYV